MINKLLSRILGVRTESPEPVKEAPPATTPISYEMIRRAIDAAAIQNEARRQEHIHAMLEGQSRLYHENVMRYSGYTPALDEPYLGRDTRYAFTMVKRRMGEEMAEDMRSVLNGLRDPDRIPRILTKIQILWEMQPDTRLIQMLMNLQGSMVPTYNAFYVEDTVIEGYLDKAIAEADAKQRRSEPTPGSSSESPESR
jgi:hypothetical protein